MKTELTIEESLEREKSMIFPSDMSEHTLLAVVHSHNCIRALEKQIPRKIGGVENYACPRCNKIFTRETYPYCPWCGQAIDWGKHHF